MNFRLFILLISFTVLCSCEKIALVFSPRKELKASHSPLATNAENRFWETLHGGRHQDIPQSQRLLTAAYLENPNDPQLAAHIGFI